MKYVWFQACGAVTRVGSIGQLFDITSRFLVCIGRPAVHVTKAEQTLFSDPEFGGAIVMGDTSVWFRFVRGDRKGK